MPDEFDDAFDPKEVPTSPDLGHICPNCEGIGSRLVDISDNPARPRMVRRMCRVCMGRKKLMAEELSVYRAQR